MMRILFFLIFLNILNGQNKPLSFFEQNTLNELSYDSIVKTESISKFLETNDKLKINESIFKLLGPIKPTINNAISINIKKRSKNFLKFSLNFNLIFFNIKLRVL